MTTRKPWAKSTDHGRMTGRPWRRLREQVFKRDEYLCVICRAAGRVSLANICDHRIPLSQKGSNEITNLQSLCIECSDAKSAIESHGKPTTPKGCDANGEPLSAAHPWNTSGGPFR